jgi:hypothetical protein
VVRLVVEYAVRDPIEGIHFGFIVRRSTDNMLVYDANFTGDELGRDRLSGGQRFRVVYEAAAHLTRGQYHIESHVFHNASSRFIARRNPAGHFRVDENRTYAGIADLGARASTADIGGQTEIGERVTEVRHRPLGRA